MDMNYYPIILGDVWDRGTNLIPEVALMENYEHFSPTSELCQGFELCYRSIEPERTP